MDLNKPQIKALSAICQDVAQVSLASIAVPYILNLADLNLAILGFATTIAFWAASLILLHRD